MDFHAAMETFAEAWVAANTQTAVNTEHQPPRSTPVDDLPTMLSKEQLSDARHGQMMKMKKSPFPDQAIPTSSGSGKSIPVHCIVEQTVRPTDGSTSSTTHTRVDRDSYAILPGTTLFSEIVRAALVKLGYSSTDAIGAKGAVQIKNWKPLTFDSVTDNPDATVEEILGELTSVATLRIRLCSAPKINALDDVKEKLLQVLLHQAQGVLITSGCPIEKTVLSLLSEGKTPSEITSEMKCAFEKWYKDQLLKLSQLHSSPPAPGPMDLSMSDPVSHSTPVNYSVRNTDFPLYTSIMGKRIRTFFDPEHEIPRLHYWFQHNHHPTREQMLGYLKELNSLESRWGRKPLDLTNMIYWFKNARAAQRRANRTTESCPDDSAEADDIEDRLSPSPLENVPLLPNKNAVYIVKDPLYCGSRENKTSAHELNGSYRQTPDEDQENMDASTANPEMAQSNTLHNTSQEGMVENNREGRESTMELTKPLRAKSVESSSGDSQSSSSFSSNEKSGIPIMNGGENVVNVNNNNNDNEVFVKKEVKTEGDSDHDQGDTMDVSHDEDNSRDIQSVSNLGNNPAIHPMPYSLHHNIHIAPVPLSLHYIPPVGHRPIYPQMGDAHLLSNPRQLSQQVSSQLNSDERAASEERTEEHYDERRKRSRVFIDPITEVPKLEKWFSEDTHPSSITIEKYADDLNQSEYRHRFPKLEPKNVQLWFKNHRAKVKRARVEDETVCENGSSSLQEDASIHVSE